MKYPSIKDDDFYHKINNIYKKYTIPKEKKTLKQICFPQQFELQVPQKFLAQYINPNTPYKGVLVYHRIGAGKTCTAIRVAEEWKYYRKIIVVLPASLKGNFRNELRSLCAGNNYLKPDERELLTKLHPTDDKYKEIIEKSDERIDKYYKIYSYNKFIEQSQEKKIKLTNTILIIDEIQNMISEDGTYYNVLYDLIQQAPTDLRLLLLSATPMFDKPGEIALTMNLLRIPHELPIGQAFNRKYIDMKETSNGKFVYSVKHIDDFKNKIRGYVSFFRGAPQHVFPEMNIKYVKCEMSDFQYSAYKSVLKNDDNYSMERQKKKLSSDLFVKNLPNYFFIGTRYVSNIVFPNKKINEEGFVSFKPKAIRNNLEMYSCKFAKIMKKVSKVKGKVFIYSGFKNYGGIKSLAHVLDAFGYKNYNEFGEGRKRYAIWSGDEDIAQKEEVRSVFNRKENLDGSKLKIILGSPSIKEGVSLTAVRQVHILEPYWNNQRLEQVIGRASRFCSHKDVPFEDRNVKVYVYLATHPDEKETVDEYIYYLSEQKSRIIDIFEQAIKEVAVDCTLFKNLNQTNKDDPIKCEK
jgi:superfamily II DNA or RNA helicase